ncbi:MAG: hypothetical protein HQK57_10700, partial [Deltaproteobacteria bacterium]|nr:hypothetical protein [Deltaproteobacteria bacterium]
KVYDFVEFVLKNSGDDWSRYLRQAINEALESENAAYRVVENEIVEITDQNEIAAIESAIEEGPTSSSTHFQSALKLLSDRRQPDYRNSTRAHGGIRVPCIFRCQIHACRLRRVCELPYDQGG